MDKIEDLTSSDSCSDEMYKSVVRQMKYMEASPKTRKKIDRKRMKKKNAPPAAKPVPVARTFPVLPKEDEVRWVYSIQNGTDPALKILTPTPYSKVGERTFFYALGQPSPSSTLHLPNNIKPGGDPYQVSTAHYVEKFERSYEPHKQIPMADLAVSKPKVAKLENWMKRALLSTKTPNIMLLTGPTGSGKTATVYAVASYLNVRVMEWITPMDEYQDPEENRYQSTSQAAKFLEFLLAGSRYQPVIGPCNPRKVILVEDYPNVFLRTPSVFHETLQKFLEKGRCPLIFITTDAKRKISLDLFPEKVMQSGFIEHMCFNPVADTFMRKAIDRIALRESKMAVNTTVRNAICAAAMGDVRSAENIWKFRYAVVVPAPSSPEPGPSSAVAGPSSAVPGPSSAVAGPSSAVPGPSGVKRRGRGAKPAPKKKPVLHIDTKDPGFDKLHCVGRVLYAKREPEPVENGSRDPDPRGYLRSDPNDIVSQFLSDRQSFVALAHENYPAILSSIEQVAEAADNISFADVLAPAHRLDLDQLAENSFSVAVRGIMHACTDPVMKWYPLRKSRFREVDEAHEKFLQKVKLQYAGSPYSLTTAMVDMIPLLHNLEKIHPYDKTDTGRRSPIPHITDSDDSDDD